MPPRTPTLVLALVQGLAMLFGAVPVGAAALALGQVEAASPCDAMVEAAVGRAAADDLAGAGRLLDDALLRCPDHVGVLRELAAVRFREGRRVDAEALARRLVALDPTVAWGWDLLGTLRYLDDDAVAALRAWNRIGRPRLDAVEVLGPAGSPPASVTGLHPGSVVTPGDLVRARRRLEAVPGVSRARVGYRPLAGGLIRVQGTATRPAPHTLTRGALPLHLARALGGALRVEAFDRAGWGERVVLEGALDREYRDLRLSLAHRAPLEAVAAAKWTLHHQVTNQGEDHRTERTGVRSMFLPWPSARTRGAAGTGVDHWPGFGTHGVLEGSASFDLARVLALHLDGSWWTGRFGRSEVAIETIVDRHTRPGATEEVGGDGPDRFRVGPALRARTALISLHGVTPGDTPDDLGPRFGGRRSSTHPMRAIGRILPSGDAWVHGTMELTHGWSTSTGIVMGGALFADGVRGIGGLGGVAGTDDMVGSVGSVGSVGTDGPGGTHRRWALHLGSGLRLGIPGADGWLRADWAVDPTTGRSRVSVAWASRDE